MANTKQYLKLGLLKGISRGWFRSHVKASDEIRKLLSKRTKDISYFLKQDDEVSLKIQRAFFRMERSEMALLGLRSKSVVISVNDARSRAKDAKEILEMIASAPPRRHGERRVDKQKWRQPPTRRDLAITKQLLLGETGPAIGAGNRLSAGRVFQIASKTLSKTDPDKYDDVRKIWEAKGRKAFSLAPFRADSETWLKLMEEKWQMPQ